MNFKLIKAKNEIQPDVEWDYCILSNPVDKRGRKANDFCLSNSKESVSISYDSKTMKLANISEIENLQAGIKLLIDTTTVGFVELLILLDKIKSKIKSFDLLYLEPENYTNQDKTDLISRYFNRKFDLSDEINGFYGIPPFAPLSTDHFKSEFYFFVGYEGERLQRVIDDQEIRAEDSTIVFGVPAFSAGWEMNAIANAVNVMDLHNFNAEILYCGAENPLSVYNLLKEAYQGLENHDDFQLIIVPIGTKPMGIGVALFATEHEKVRILYDHPVRKKGRSKEIANWHLYSISF